MIAGLASLVFIPLLALVFAHLRWALGSTWPVKDKTALARTVIGTPDIDKMPNRLVTLSVALFFAVAGLAALALSAEAPSPGLTGAGVVFALIFMVRGVSGYLPAWQARHPTEPFASFDKKVYSPISLFIGAGFALLVIWSLS